MASITHGTDSNYDCPVCGEPYLYEIGGPTDTVQHRNAVIVKSCFSIDTAAYLHGHWID